MMRIKLNIIGLFLYTLIGLPLTVLASVRAPTGVVIGAQMGYNSLNTWPKNPAFPSLPLGSTHQHLSWNVFAGYDFAITDHLQMGMEIGYNNNGRITYIGHNFIGRVNITDTSVLLTTSYILASNVSVFAKLGGALVTEDAHTTYLDFTAKDWQPKAVTGIGYMLSHNFEMTLAYEHTFGKGEAYVVKQTAIAQQLLKIQAINRIMVGINYTIPMGY